MFSMMISAASLQLDAPEISPKNASSVVAACEIVLDDDAERIRAGSMGSILKAPYILSLEGASVAALDIIFERAVPRFDKFCMPLLVAMVRVALRVSNGAAGEAKFLGGSSSVGDSAMASVGIGVVGTASIAFRTE